jgi:hypothetical protein
MKFWFYLLGLSISLNLSMMAPTFNLSAPKATTSNSVLINESKSKESVNAPVDIFENPESEDIKDNIDDYAGMISIKDEASINDEALVLAHIQSDIEDFEDLKKTIAYLKHHLGKHADIHVVKSLELEEADKVLKELDVKVIKFYEQELMSLKSQIPKLKHKFDNQSIDEITLIVENAEMFLQLSMEKIEGLEMLEQEWEVAEESAEIQEAIHQDEMWEHSKKILIEALKPSVSDEFKKKMSDQDDDNKPPIAYPTSKPGGIKINLNKSGSENSSMYKKMKNTKMLNNDLSERIGDDDMASDEGNVKKDSDDGFANDDDLDNVKDSRYEDVERLQEIAELARIDALKKVEENLKKELESDRRGRKNDIDPVEYYSKEVQEALKSAKETSQEFIDKKLYHHGAHEEEVILIFFYNILSHLYLSD